jgi:hypothetical protein
MVHSTEATGDENGPLDQFKDVLEKMVEQILLLYICCRRSSELFQTLNVNKWRYHLMRWIVRKHLPFTITEDDDFEEMLMVLNQSISRYLLTGDSVPAFRSTRLDRDPDLLDRDLDHAPVFPIRYAIPPLWRLRPRCPPS